MIIIASLALLSRAVPLPAWQIYTFRDGTFASQSSAHEIIVSPTFTPTSSLPTLPADWHTIAAELADVTGDGEPEWVLLIRRPWRDWPVQKWTFAPSPIAGFHDAAGDSCHLILLDPESGREVWAGSALPAPLLALAVGDVNGDGLDEVVTLEGNYAAGWRSPAGHVNVWRWNGFGFSLAWRSPKGSFHQLSLASTDGRETPAIAVR
jgi:hypothetical protein